LIRARIKCLCSIDCLPSNLDNCLPDYDKFVLPLFLIDLGFRILEFGFKVRLRRINLIKNDRAKRYNKSAIRNPKSKIAPKSRFKVRKMEQKLRTTLYVIFITLVVVYNVRQFFHPLHCFTGHSFEMVRRQS
jgi:hypothetical protein